MTAKNFFLQKSEKISKNAEFHADFESVAKVVKKCTQKKVISKESLTNMRKKWKRAFSVTFLLITFLWCIFSKLFQRNSKSAWNSAFFDTHIEFFLNKIFYFLFSTFSNLWLQMRRKRLIRTENLFLWMCLRILLGNHQRVCISKLLNSLYPNVQIPEYVHTFSLIITPTHCTSRAFYVKAVEQKL